MRYRISTRFYSRDNISSEYFSNEFLEEIAEEIKNRVEGRDYSNIKEVFKEIKSILDEYEFDVGEGYEIDYDNRSVKLYDKKIDKAGSWGYDEIVLTILPQKPRLLESLRKVLSKIKDDDKYIVVSGHKFKSDVSPLENIYYFIREILESKGEDEDYDFGSPFEDVEIILTGDEVKKCINEWIEFVLRTDKESPGYAYGWEVDVVPICTQNPYAAAGNSWDWEGDENDLTISVTYTWYGGCHHFLSDDYITFTKLTNEEKQG